jgi:integration host factor subunit alpha
MLPPEIPASPGLGAGIFAFSPKYRLNAEKIACNFMLYAGFGFVHPSLLSREVSREITMTKAEIVQALYDRVGGFSKKESADLVDLVFDMMKETLAKGEKIKVSGFGNFVLRDKRQRPGRNPQTGDPIKISERRVLTFKALNSKAITSTESPITQPSPTHAEMTKAADQ